MAVSQAAAKAEEKIGHGDNAITAQVLRTSQISKGLQLNADVNRTLQTLRGIARSMATRLRP